MIGWLLGPWVILVQAYVVLYLAYLWTPALAAIATARRGSRALQPARRQRRFAILVSAHDEERVVGALLESLAAQDYPVGSWRAYVVANMCTDATAHVVRAQPGAVCHERTDADIATKGAALAWLWQRVRAEAVDYDTVLILDADNLVPPDFLAQMNGVLDAGFSVVQSARRAKNAGDTWTSQLDGVSEALWNRLDQAGRMRLGLSATIAGSGMAFDRNVFEALVGGGAPGLLEDIEWQARLMLAGVRVGFADGAQLFDEKTSRPEELGRQRKRWVAGIVVAARLYGWRLLADGIRQRDPRRLVAAFATTKPPRSVLLLLLGGLTALGYLAPAAVPLMPWWLWLAGLASFVLYVLAGMLVDRATPAAYRALACAPVFAAILVTASVAGALRASSQRWVPTSHKRGLTIDQLQDRSV